MLQKHSSLPTSKRLTHCTSKYVAITYHKYTGYVSRILLSIMLPLQLTKLRCFNLLILLYCWSLSTKILKSNQLQMHVKNSSGLASGAGNGCAFLLCLLCHGLITVWRSSICLNIKWIAQVKIFVLLSAWKCHCGEGKATLKRKIKEHKCHSVYSGLRSSRAWRAGMFAWLDDYPVLWIMLNVTHLALPFADLWGLFEHLHVLRSRVYCFGKFVLIPWIPCADGSDTKSKFSISNSLWISIG